MMSCSQGTMSLADGYVLMASIAVAFALAVGAFAWWSERKDEEERRTSK